MIPMKGLFCFIFSMKESTAFATRQNAMLGIPGHWTTASRVEQDRSFVELK